MPEIAHFPFSNLKDFNSSSAAVICSPLARQIESSILGRYFELL